MTKYEKFRKRHIANKNELIEMAKREMNEVLLHSESDPLHSSAYYGTFKRLVMDFINEVDKLTLMEKLEDGWCYDFGVNYYGVDLQLLHFEVYDGYEDDDSLLGIDQVLTIYTLPSKLLTVEEFAEMHGVEVVTVRQWIRRGKIRTAKKYGNEWRIPALTDTPKRGYTSAVYKWNDKLSGLPKELEYLNDYCEAVFSQDLEEKRVFWICLYDKKGAESVIREAGKTIQCTATEREKIELAIISQPSVDYLPNYEDSILIDLMNLHREDNELDTSE